MDERPEWAERIQAERLERGWSTWDMARRLYRAVGIPEAGTSKIKNLARQVTRWETGRHFPRDWSNAYARALGIERGRLFAANAAEVDKTGTLLGIVDRGPTADGGDNDVRRRELFQDTVALGAGAATASVLTVLTQAWRVSRPKLPGATVSQDMIDDWEDAAHVHAERARVHPPVAVLGALAAEFADMAPHLAAEQPDRVRADLAHAAAPHAMLIAGKLVDLGDRREARRWWARTRRLGDESGDRLLASWVRSREALYRRGDPAERLPEVLAVAREARRLAGDRPSAPRVAALTAEAQTLALMRRHEQAVTALEQAERAFADLPENRPGLAGGDVRGLWFDKSLVFSLAGDVKRAVEAQDVLMRHADRLTAIEVGLHRATLHAHEDPEAIGRAVQIIGEIPRQGRRARYLTAARMVLDVAPEKTQGVAAARELRVLTAGV